MRGRPIRCPFCATVQEVPRRPWADGPAAPPEQQRRRVLAVEPVPDRIVIESGDLDEMDPPPPPPRVPPAMLDPNQRHRIHQAWLRRETLAAADDAVGQTCPFCQTKLSPGTEAVICSACGTPHHAECWAENEGCTQFGCQLAPFRSSGGQPPGAAATGPLTAACLGCGAAVRAGDVYCTHCGRPVSRTAVPPPTRPPAAPRRRPPRMAGEALLFGLLSLVCGPLFVLFAPLAIFYGTRSLQELQRLPDQAGQGTAVAGIILGVLSAILWVIVGITLLPHLMR